MRNFKLYIYCLLFIGAVQVTSCKKYLDVKSDFSLIVPSTLFDLRTLLDDRTFMNSYTPAFGASASDDYFITDNTFNSLQVQPRNFYKWIPYEYKYINDWALAYNAVYNANLCLERVQLLDRNKVSKKEWDDVLGSALFYRAYYFLEMAWLFSKSYDKETAATDTGIVLRESSDFNVASVRASVQVTYDKILKDTKEALLYLPDYPGQVTRPSKGAAYGLLARTYLSMREYDSAGLYANRALQLKSDLMDYNDASVVNVYSGDPFTRFNTETVFYTTMNFFSTQLYHPLFGHALVDTTLYSTYDNNDLRKEAFFTLDNNYYRFKGNYAGGYEIFSGIANDELFLIRAECFARKGNVQEAMNDINFLLSKRWISGTYQPISSPTAQAALEFILKERRKELICRGSLRWMDIKRLNKEDANITLTRIVENETYTLPPNDTRFVLPLPKDIVDQGIPQNLY